MNDRRSPRPRRAIAPHVAVILAAGFLLVGTHSKPARAACAVVSVASLGALMGLVHRARRTPARSAVPRPKWAGRDAIRARPRRADQLNDAERSGG